MSTSKMQLLIILAAVLTSSLVAATDESGQCVSRQEFDTLKEQLARSRQETAAVKGEVDSWQNSTLLILKQENLSDVKTTLQQIKDELTEIKQEMREEHITTRNTSLQGVEECVNQVTNNIRKVIDAAHNSSALPCASPVGSYQNPATSCKDIGQLQPSGYYWIGNSSENISQVYCNMTRRCNSTGGWMRVAYFDMTNNLTTCPPGFRQISSPKRTCGRSQQSAGCSSVSFSPNGIAYSKVCGRVTGYQYGSTSGFHTTRYPSNSIEGPYLEGVSVTHGRSPRKHVWSFANAMQDAYGYDNNRHICPCRPGSRMPIPSFVGNDYFCDTSNPGPPRSGVFFTNNALWDGQGCNHPDCCSYHSPPWFCKKLSYSTADDIEVRICADEGYSNEDSPIELIEIYVQ